MHQAFLDVAQFLLDVIVQPFAIILLLRFHLQWLRAPMLNPVGEFIMGITNFVVLRTRRYIPSIKGYDTSTLLLAYVVEVIYMYLYEFIFIYHASDSYLMPVALLLIGIVKLLSLSVTLLMAAVIIQAILSWVNPHTAISPILNAITRPFIRPLQKYIPPAGNVDLSSFVLIILCYITQRIPLYLLDSLVRSII